MDPIQNGNPREQNKIPSQNVPSIRTYKSDVAEFIKREGKTLADIAIAESAKQSNVLKEEAVAPAIKKRATYIVGAIVVLVIISILTLWLILRPSPNANPATAAGTQISIFVSGIKEKTVSIDGQNENEALSTINLALEENSPFLVLKVTSQKKSDGAILMTSRDFLEKMGIYPPGDLIRSFTDNFAIGSIGGKARFLVIKNSYYSGAFAGMLEWENKMIGDLHNLLNLAPIKNSNLIKTATTGTTTALSQIKLSQFEDGVVANRDARIFRDRSGATTLLYLFPDNNTIIITGSESIARVITEKLLRMGSK